MSGGLGAVRHRLVRLPVVRRLGAARLPQPWRGEVETALRSQREFLRVAGGRHGPLTARLAGLAEAVDDVVRDATDRALLGSRFSRARQQVDSTSSLRTLAQLEQERQRRGSARDPVAEQTAAALRAHLDAAGRLDAAIAGVAARLVLANARLQEVAARAVELSARASDPATVASVQDELHGLVGELESLRRGLDDVEQVGRALPAAAPDRTAG